MDGTRLTGEHRFIHAALAADDDAVDGNAFSRPHEDDVGPPDLLNRELDLARVAQHARRLRLQVDQSPQRRRRASLRPCFDEIAEQDERDDEDDRLVVQIAGDATLEEDVGRERGD